MNDNNLFRVNTRNSTGSTRQFGHKRATLYHILHHRKGYKSLTNFGKWLHGLFTVITIISIITLCLSTDPSIKNTQYGIDVYAVDTSCMIVFIIELILHMIAAPSIKHVLHWRYLIDVLVILPFLIEIIYALATYSSQFINAEINGVQFIGAFRVMRVFRIIKILGILKKSRRLRMMGRALKDSWDGILLLVATLPFLVVFFSTLLYYAEQLNGSLVDGFWYYPNGNKSPFQSIPDCFWVVIVTLTTIGYGDVVAYTLTGRIVLVGVMVISLFVVAFPLTMISVTYTNVYRYYNQKRRQEKLNRQMEDLMDQSEVSDLDDIEKPTIKSVLNNQQQSNDPILLDSSPRLLPDWHIQTYHPSTDSSPSVELPSGWMDRNVRRSCKSASNVSKFKSKETFFVNSKTQDLIINQQGAVVGGKLRSNYPGGIDVWEMEREAESTFDGPPSRVALRVVEWQIEDGKLSEETMLLIKLHLNDPKKFRKLVNLLASFE